MLYTCDRYHLNQARTGVGRKHYRPGLMLAARIFVTLDVGEVYENVLKRSGFGSFQVNVTATLRNPQERGS